MSVFCLAREQLADNGVLLRTGNKAQLLLGRCAQQRECEGVYGTHHGSLCGVILEAFGKLAAQPGAGFLRGSDNEDAGGIRAGLPGFIQGMNDGIDKEAGHTGAGGTGYLPGTGFGQVNRPTAGRGGLGTGNEAHLRGRWKDHSRTRGGMGVVTHRSSMADARDTRCCSTRSMCERVFERDAECRSLT